MRARHLLPLLLALLVLPVCAQPKNAPSAYATLLAQLKAGDTHIDFARLRLSYPDSPEYKAAPDTSTDEKAMAADLDSKNYASSLKHAQTVLAGEYLNIDAHFVAYVAHKQLGQQDRAAFHLAVFRGLLDSIRASGDGQSPATAWVIISVHEEYVMLRALGFMPSQQSLLHQNGHYYDKMVVKSVQDGSEHTFYFNTDIPIKEGL
jgi:Domain of unknown function (DUF4919)